jgi:hypothetical protein
MLLFDTLSNAGAYAYITNHVAHSLQKWKAFAAQTEAITKALKKKDSAGAMKAYQDAIIALDEYLGLVELPSAKEITSS